MNLKGYHRNLLHTYNQPEKFDRAFKLLLLRNNLTAQEVAMELDRHRNTIGFWRSGRVGINQSIAIAVCAVFNITANDLALLVEDPAYIEEIAPRVMDIDQNPMPGKRCLIYSTRNGYIEYICETEKGDYFLKVCDHRKAKVFTMVESDYIIKKSPKKFILRQQIFLEKMVAGRKQ